MTINFMDVDDSLINEFSSIAAGEGVQPAVDFAVAHSGCTRAVAREVAETIGDDTEESETAFFALAAQMERTPAEIVEAMGQACDRAWANRAAQNSVPMSAGPWAELMLKYPDLHEPQHHGEYAGGYYSGVLAALRWVTGDGWNADT